MLHDWDQQSELKEKKKSHLMLNNFWQLYMNTDHACKTNLDHMIQQRPMGTSMGSTSNTLICWIRSLKIDKGTKCTGFCVIMKSLILVHESWSEKGSFTLVPQKIKQCGWTARPRQVLVGPTTLGCRTDLSVASKLALHTSFENLRILLMTESLRSASKLHQLTWWLLIYLWWTTITTTQQCA